MLAMQQLLRPAVPQTDRIAHDVSQHREQALSRVLSTLQKWLDMTDARETRKALSLFASLPATARQQILKHPHYHHWWFRLSQCYREDNFQRVAHWLPEFARFLVVPALQHGSWPEDGLQVPVNQVGELRFPGHLRHIVLPDVPASQAVLLSRSENGLMITYEGQAYAIRIDDLLDQSNNTSSSFIRQRFSIPGTTIEVDSSDPWTQDLLDSSRLSERDRLHSEGDTLPAPVQEDDLRSLQATLVLLQQCWPEMHTEIAEYVRLIVPFESGLKSAFTNTIWSRAVFLRAKFGNQLYNLERLVHETSHLRLNEIMAEVALHHHSWDDRVPSPFRTGLRPVTGLYHGAFVFTRVAHAMSQAFSLSGEMAYRRRIPQVVRQVVEALETLTQQVRLTQEGQALLEEITTEIQRLKVQYPPLSEDSDVAFDPYLQEW